MTILQKFLGNESGATAIEYALIVALIAVATVASIANFHEKLGGTYTYISTAIAGTM